MTDAMPAKIPLKWFEIYYIPPDGPWEVAMTFLVSETHESASLAALQRIPMRKLLRTRECGAV